MDKRRGLLVRRQGQRWENWGLKMVRLALSSVTPTIGPLPNTSLLRQGDITVEFM